MAKPTARSGSCCGADDVFVIRAKMNATVLLLLPDFLLIAAGAGLRRLPSFPPALWAGVERLVYFIFFPALLYRSLAQSGYSLAAAAKPLEVAVAVTLTAIGLSALAAPALRLPRPTFAACFQCGFRFNTYVILAAAARLPGTDSLALASVLIGVLVPLVNVAAVMALAEGGPTHMLRELGRNPLILATVAGILTHALGARLPALGDHVLALLASAALPLGLLAVGAALRMERGAVPVSALLWFHSIKLAVLPGLAWAAARAVGLSLPETQVVVIVAAVPTATSAYILAVQMRGDGRAAAWLITSGTLLAAVTLPLWLALVTVS
jgi:hypothetical protein